MRASKRRKREYKTSSASSTLLLFVSLVMILQLQRLEASSSNRPPRRHLTSEETRYRPEKGSVNCQDMPTSFFSYYFERNLLPPCRGDPYLVAESPVELVAATKAPENWSAERNVSMVPEIQMMPPPDTAEIFDVPEGDFLDFDVPQDDVFLTANTTDGTSLVYPGEGATKDVAIKPEASPQTEVAFGTQQPILEFGITGGSTLATVDTINTGLVDNVAFVQYAQANLVHVRLYVGLRPYHPSISLSVSSVVSEYFNSTLKPKLVTYSTTPSITNSNMYAMEWIDPVRLAKNGTKYVLSHGLTDAQLVEQMKTTWWWMYNISFYVYSPQELDYMMEVYEVNELKIVQDTLNEAIVDGILRYSDIEEMLQTKLGHDEVVVIDKLIDDEVEEGGEDADVMDVDESDMESPPPPPPPPLQVLRSDGTFTNAVDAREWKWWRYLGLGLFCFTLLIFSTATLIANYRKRQEIRKEVWGNLASEQGIDKLLSTGWKYEDDSGVSKTLNAHNAPGDKLHVFDKSKWGYRDDDSMLIGGFEQTHVGVGTEITVTHPSSETTPETTRQL